MSMPHGPESNEKETEEILDGYYNHLKGNQMHFVSHASQRCDIRKIKMDKASKGVLVSVLVVVVFVVVVVVVVVVLRCCVQLHSSKTRDSRGLSTLIKFKPSCLSMHEYTHNYYN